EHVRRVRGRTGRHRVDGARCTNARRMAAERGAARLGLSDLLAVVRARRMPLYAARGLCTQPGASGATARGHCATDVLWRVDAHKTDTVGHSTCSTAEHENPSHFVHRDRGVRL